LEKERQKFRRELTTSDHQGKKGIEELASSGDKWRSLLQNESCRAHILSISKVFLSFDSSPPFPYCFVKIRREKIWKRDFPLFLLKFVPLCFFVKI
jgi:hypothetical protein